MYNFIVSFIKSINEEKIFVLNEKMMRNDGYSKSKEDKLIYPTPANSLILSCLKKSEVFDLKDMGFNKKIKILMGLII